MIHSFKHCMTVKHRRWIRISKLQHWEETPKENPLSSLSYWDDSGLRDKQVRRWGGLTPKKELDRERAPSRDHQSIPKDFEISSVHKSENARQMGKGSPEGTEGRPPEASRGLGLVHFLSRQWERHPNTKDIRKNPKDGIALRQYYLGQINSWTKIYLDQC